MRLWSKDLLGVLKEWVVTSGEVRSFGFLNTDEALVASGKGNEDPTLEVWSLISGERIRSLQGHRRQVWAVAVLSSEAGAVSGSLDQSIRLWNLEKGESLVTLKGHSMDVNSVQIMPD